MLQALEVDNTLRGLEAAKKKFRDHLFPADKAAIRGCSGEKDVTQWCRPSEFCGKANGGVRSADGFNGRAEEVFLFKDDMVASDVVQGRWVC